MICVSFDLYSLDSGLDSDDPTDFSRKAILFEQSDINKLVHHLNEKLNHFSAKAILFMILRDLKHDVLSEVEIVGVGVCDLFDKSVNVIYEIETSHSPKYRREANEIYKQTGVEVIVIYVKDLPDDIFQRYMKLKEYVIPD